MLTVHQEAIGSLHLVLRSDGGVYLGRPDEHRVLDVREMLRLGSSPTICGALAEALTRMAEFLRNIPALGRFDEEKPPAGHHAPAAEEVEP